MKVNILFFATLRDLVGEKRFEFSTNGDSITVANLRHELIKLYPQVKDNLNAATVAVNEEFAFAEDTISDGDEVAFFPPVSGGSNHPELFLLPDAPIDHDEIVEAITTPETGAVCFFSGMVRGRTDKEGHIPETEYLEYEAYEPMALSKMRQVAQEIREQFPKVQGIAMAQRIGRLSVGQNTVLIACSSAHRDDGCFEAARYGIDRLKEIVPVWKKEIGTDGEAWVEGDYTPKPDDRQI